MEMDYTEYEKERDEHVRRNRERLKDIGISTTISTMESSFRKRKSRESKQVAPKRRKDIDETEGLGRRPFTRSQVEASDRKKRNEGRQVLKQSETFKKQLGEFLVTGVCPKCHGNYERAHTRHLKTCKGKDRIPKTKKKGEAKDSKPSNNIDARIMQLFFNGVRDFNGMLANYSVTGSSGNIYTVTFSEDGKRKCTCLDHRFRRRDCKHILLVMKILGIEKTRGKGWKEATALLVQEEKNSPSEKKTTQPNRIKSEPLPRTKEERVALDFL